MDNVLATAPRDKAEALNDQYFTFSTDEKLFYF